MIDYRYRRRLGYIGLAAILASGSCGREPDIRITNSRTITLEEWTERIGGAQEVTRVGRLDDPDPAYILGEISDLTMDPAGNLLVLDRMYHELKVFDSAGSHLETIGREGRGPEEFLQPRALVWNSADELMILDGPLRAASYHWNGDGSYRFERTLPTTMVVRSACHVDGAVLLHGTYPGGQYRVYRLNAVPDGGVDLEKGFAPILEDEHPLLQRRRSEGFMDCAGDEAGVVLLTGDYFPDVRAFESDGTLRWNREVPDFTPMKFTRVGSGARIGLRQSIDPEAGGFNRIVSAVVLDPETFLVQVSWETAESSALELPWAQLRTYLFSATTGESLYAGDEIPLVLEALSNGYLAVEPSPFARALVFRYPGIRTGPKARE